MPLKKFHLKANPWKYHLFTLNMLIIATKWVSTQFEFFLTPDERQKSSQESQVNSKHQIGLRNKSSSRKTHHSDDLHINHLSNTKNKPRGAIKV